jgi:hypothetical protein
MLRNFFTPYLFLPVKRPLESRFIFRAIAFPRFTLPAGFLDLFLFATVFRTSF